MELAPIPIEEGGVFAGALPDALGPAWEHVAELAPGPRQVLVTWLARRWLALARTCLAAEAAASPPRWRPDPGFWRGLLASYPALARVCAVSEAAWRREVSLVVERARADLVGEVTELAILGSGYALPASAIAVTMSGGTRRVYKPRDLRLTAWFVGLCAELGTLHVRRVDPRDGYGWDELVEAAPCPPEAVSRYFHRAGALLRLAQLLRTVDLHRRNVVAAGEHPVLIDLDGLFHPVTPARSPLADTPLGTGFLPLWIVGEPGRAPFNGGGLSHDDAGTMPFPRWVFGGDEGLSLVKAYEADRTPATAPASLYPHRDAILAGFEEMDARLAGFASLPARLAAAAALPTRTFLRPLALHKRILRESLKPGRARSDATRDAALRAAVDGPVALAELAALRDGWLPVFHTLPGGDGLILPDGSTRPRFFEACALDRIVAPPAPPRDLDVIVTAIAVCEEPPPGAVSAAPRARDWVAAATEIADGVLDAGLDIGVEWVPHAGVRRLSGSSADLLSGAAGMAVVMAQLAVVTGHARYGEAVVTLARRVAAAVEQGGRGAGAYTGLGGQLYALRRCAVLLRDGTLALRVTYRAAALRGDAGLATAPLDMVNGLAGLAAVCPEAWLGEEILRLRAARPPAPVGRHGLPAFAPSYELGLAWALERIARATGDPRFAVVQPAPPPPATPLDELEAALDAGRRAEATEAAARIVGRKDATGSWLPESSVADRLNPSGLSGLLAVAYAFLRLASPAKLPSLRWLEG